MTQSDSKLHLTDKEKWTFLRIVTNCISIDSAPKQHEKRKPGIYGKPVIWQPLISKANALKIIILS